MSGAQLPSLAGAVRPSVKFLFMTGYAEMPTELETVPLPEGAGIMRKPFSIEGLEDAIRKAMAGE